MKKESFETWDEEERFFLEKNIVENGIKLSLPYATSGIPFSMIKLKPELLIIYAVISSLRDSSGFIFASNRFLEKILGWNRTVIQRRISSLIQKGYLEAMVVNNRYRCLSFPQLHNAQPILVNVSPDGRPRQTEEKNVPITSLHYYSAGVKPTAVLPLQGITATGNDKENTYFFDSETFFSLRGPKKGPLLQKALDIVYEAYKTKINNRSKLTEGARKKIATRFEEYSINQLLEAIDRFSQNEWRMKNNADKPLVWFFRSEDQIETFLNLKADKNRTQVIKIV